VGPGNRVLDGGPDPPWEGAILRGKRHPVVKYRDTLWSSVQRQLKRSRYRLGCGLERAQRIFVLDGGPEMLRNVAMAELATNFGMQFTVTGFLALFDGL